MDRISTRGTSPVLPARRTPTTAPGYFSDGDPTAGTMATLVGADWLNGIQEELLYIIESASLVPTGTDLTQLAQALFRLTRLRLQADAIFHAAPNGSDNNDGRTEATPWQTLQHAYNWIRDRLDPSAYRIAVQLADGTYAPFLASYPIIGSPLTFIGNVNDPTRVVINNPNGSAITVDNQATIVTRYLKVTAAGGAGASGMSVIGGRLTFDNIDFGACEFAHMYSSNDGVISVSSRDVAYSVSGGAASHVSIFGGRITIDGAAVTITGNPAFRNTFAEVTSLGLFLSRQTRFSGAATGKRFNVAHNSIIDVAGAGDNALPGTLAGTKSSGGQVV